jgi:hypothetical protein
MKSFDPIYIVLILALAAAILSFPPFGRVEDSITPVDEYQLIVPE